MTSLTFALETENIQNLIDRSSKDNATEQLPQNIFNKLMNQELKQKVLLVFLSNMDSPLKIYKIILFKYYFPYYV